MLFLARCWLEEAHSSLSLSVDLLAHNMTTSSPKSQSVTVSAQQSHSLFGSLSRRRHSILAAFGLLQALDYIQCTLQERGCLRT